MQLVGVQALQQTEISLKSARQNENIEIKDVEMI